jgi:hypothetical protein
MSRNRCVRLGMGGLLVIGSALAASAPGAETTRPAGTQPAAGQRPAAWQEQADGATRAIRQAVAAIAPGLGSESFATREKAEKAICGLASTLFDTVIENTQWDDPEQRARLKSSLKAAGLAMARANFYASFPPDKRVILRKAEAAKPEAFQELFGESDAAVAKAAKGLADDKDAGELVQLWALNHASPMVRLTILKAVAARPEADKRVLDAIFARLEALESRPERQVMSTGDDDESSRFATLPRTRGEIRYAYEALVAHKDPRVLEPMLKKLTGSRPYDFYDMREIVVGLIVRMKDPRTVPTLATCVEDNRTIVTSNFGQGGPSVVTKVGDIAMGIVLLQTDQSLKDYGFYVRDDGPPGTGQYTIHGFKSEEDRTAAQKKFKKWWSDNQAKYKDVKPLAAPGKEPETPPPFVY